MHHRRVLASRDILFCDRRIGFCARVFGFFESAIGRVSHGLNSTVYKHLAQSFILKIRSHFN